MTMQELLNCPFCGGRAEIERKGDRRQSTIYACTDCGCRLETGEEFNYGAAWNIRADGWRPIEGAPRDGTEILCWSPGFAMGLMVLSFYDGYWREKANGMGLKTPPTDWQPLPQPPATPSAEQSDADKV